MLYWLHVGAGFLMRFVPVDLAYRLVGVCTPLYLQVFARGHLNRATANMRQILGPDTPLRDARRLTRAAFANYARYMVDLVRLPHVAFEELTGAIHVEGWDNVERAYQHGKGVVFATGHIGSWDLAGAAFAARGHPVSALVETLRPPRWNERVQQTRTAAGVKAIPIESGVRDMLAALRRREGLAVLVDRPVAAPEGVPVTFFGRATRVPGGAATLALRTGSPVVPAALVRDTRGGYLAHIGPPIIGDQGDDASTVMQHIMSWLEGIIRRYPDQWFMFRQMWPAGESGSSSSPGIAPRFSTSEGIQA